MPSCGCWQLRSLLVIFGLLMLGCLAAPRGIAPPGLVIEGGVPPKWAMVTSTQATLSRPTVAAPIVVTVARPIVTSVPSPLQAPDKEVIKLPGMDKPKDDYRIPMWVLPDLPEGAIMMFAMNEGLPTVTMMPVNECKPAVATKTTSQAGGVLTAKKH